MPVKVARVNRWEAVLEGNASVPSFSVNSIDNDEKSIKVRLGNVERILTVEEWMSLATAVRGNVKYEAKR